MNADFNIYRILGAIAAVLAAINTYFIALPEDTIPQMVMIIMGAATIGFVALNAFISGPMGLARFTVRKAPAQLKVAQREEEASGE